MNQTPNDNESKEEGMTYEEFLELHPPEEPHEASKEELETYIPDAADFDY